MPRGIYDRAAAKAKREGKSPAKESKPKSVAKPSKTTAEDSAEVPGIVYNENIFGLRSHLDTMLKARAALTGTQIEHNPVLVRQVDAEITETISTLANWRKAQFPPEAKAEEVTESKPGPKAFTPIAAPTAAPAPLPFTPQAVQDAIKQVQS